MLNKRWNLLVHVTCLSCPRILNNLIKIWPHSLYLLVLHTSELVWLPVQIPSVEFLKAPKVQILSFRAILVYVPILNQPLSSTKSNIITSLSLSHITISGGRIEVNFKQTNLYLTCIEHLLCAQYFSWL